MKQKKYNFQEHPNSNPKPGQKVLIYFTNGTTAQGIVISWSNFKSVLKSENNSNILVIHQTLRNVMMFLTINENCEEQQKQEIPSRQTSAPNRQHFIKKAESEEQQNFPSAMSLRTQKLADLKIMQAEEEKKDFIEKARSFKLQNVSATGEYANPGFFKQHPRKKIT